MLLPWDLSQRSSLWKRGEEFLYGRNRTAGGGSRKQKKSLTAEKEWQPKGPKSCSQQWWKEHHRHPGVQAAAWAATALEIKEFPFFPAILWVLGCIFWLKYSAHSAGVPLQEHWTHTWDLLRVLKVFFFPLPQSLCFLSLKKKKRAVIDLYLKINRKKL